MISQIVFTIPDVPPRELSPNAPRGQHWSVTHQARQAWGQLVYLVAKDTMRKFPKWKAPDKAKIHLTFIYGTNRKRDEDNLVAMFKRGQDMLVRAGVIIADDSEHLKLGNVDIVVDKRQAPSTIVRIERGQIEKVL